MPMKSIPKQPDWISPHSCGPQSSQLPAPPLACGRCGKGAIPDVDARAGGGSSLGNKKFLFRLSAVCTCVLVLLFFYGIPLPRYAVGLDPVLEGGNVPRYGWRPETGGDLSVEMEPGWDFSSLTISGR
jgi:hypothetical protein